MLSRRGLHSISALGCRLERKCRHPSGWSIPHGSRTWIVAFCTMFGCPPMMTMKISSLTVTHPAIAHCIAEVDPATLLDQTRLMRPTADSDGQHLMLKQLNFTVY